jgi:acetyl-CoA acetyltransferase
MPHPRVVLSTPIRTAIGTFGGSLVTLCIGGGQGIALAVERLS